MASGEQRAEHGAVACVRSSRVDLCGQQLVEAGAQPDQPGPWPDSPESFPQPRQQHQGRGVGVHQPRRYIGEFVVAVGVLHSEHGQDDDAQCDRPGRRRECDPSARSQVCRLVASRLGHHVRQIPHTLAVQRGQEHPAFATVILPGNQNHRVLADDRLDWVWGRRFHRGRRRGQDVAGRLRPREEEHRTKTGQDHRERLTPTGPAAEETVRIQPSPHRADRDCPAPSWPGAR